MASFPTALATIPLASMTIAWVYLAQYRNVAHPPALYVSLHAVAVAAIVFSYFYLCWDYRAAGPWQYPGWGMFALGAIVFWWAAFVHKASLIPESGYALFNKGPYHYIRHPIYAGGLLGAGGLLLVAPAWQVFLAWCELLASLWLLLSIEELELSGRYGDSYAGYCRSTKRLVPFLL